MMKLLRSILAIATVAAVVVSLFATAPCALAQEADGTASPQTAPVRPALRRGVARPTPVQPPPQLRPAFQDANEVDDADGSEDLGLNFVNSDEEVLLAAYARATGRTLLVDPGIPKAKISLNSNSQSELTKEEYLQAIETVLVMNGISLVPKDDKFLLVLPTKSLRQLGIKTELDDPAEGFFHEENGRMVSQMISLKSITIEEAKKAIEGFKRDSGQIQLFERTNSILITDTAENVNRMIEIIRYIDQPLEVREETNVRPLKYAKAADIKKRLEEIVNEAQKEQQQKKEVAVAKSSGAPGIVREQVNTPPGVVRPSIRRGQPQQPTQADTPNEIRETLVADAERGVIRGKVQIVADERTNLLIIITRPENMAFFDRIINVLDVEVQTAPDVIVEVVRLEYAQAKDVASMLNDLIGNNTEKNDNDAKSTVAGSDDKGKSESLAEASDRIRRGRQTENESEGKKSKLGELKKEDVKILSDERSNAIIVMASKGDVETVKGIIADMDIMLSQVVIETVIVGISFDNSNETGMDWIQRAMLGYSGDGSGAPTLAFATAGGGATLSPRDTASLTSVDSLNSAGGITGWVTLFDWNMDLVMKAIQTDSRSHIMSSPRITTMDNKEASFESTERIYWSEGSTQYTSSDYTTDNIKNEDIGTKLKVTPRINKKGYITLTVEQEIQTSDGTKQIKTRDKVTEFPNLVSRTMSADIAVQSGETVVLGGLANNSVSKTITKVPILGSIPLLGWFFRSEKETNIRTEIIVFLTPRVLDTPAAMEDDARKLKASMDTRGVWDPTWSNSRLADPIPEKAAQEVLKRADETVAPPRNPLSGHLTAKDAEIPGAIDDPAIRAALEDGTATVPYVHFSDLGQESEDAAEDSKDEPLPSAAERLQGISLDVSEETKVIDPAELEAPIPANGDATASEETIAPSED